MNVTLNVNEEKLESVKMRHALTDIAKEIQKFNCSENGTIQHYDLVKKKNTYKSNLKMKKKQMKHITQCLRITCVVAKLLVSSKEKDIRTLKNDFIYSHTGSAHGVCNIDKYLINEKPSICDDDNISLEELIINGYIKLKKHYSDIGEDVSVKDKLKKILFYYQHNWTNLCTERSKYKVLEQRNRFLTNKINILESNLKSITETQKNFRSLRFTKLNNSVKYIEPHNQCPENFVIKNSYENNYITNKDVQNINVTGTESQYNTNLALKRHLILVKSILVDQNDLHNELKKILEEMT